MQVIFYQNNSDVNEYPKSLSRLIAVNGNFRADTVDILSPVFEISANIPKTANYMEIPALNRFYYCSLEIIRTGLMRVRGTVDVLQTYFEDAKYCPCVIARSGNAWNAKLPDNSRPFYQNTTRQYITIGDVGTPSEIVLVTVG